METLGKPQGTDERLGKRTYVTEFGLDGARDLAAESHRRGREALAEAAPGRSRGELEQITEFMPPAATDDPKLEPIDRPRTSTGSPISSSR